ncbi:hypothetical protein GCM10025857_12060 [Alicyclobacillus contaminans]|nr:hypothetical protein GCM10025857_12060 [Alicyclobacillus contaminans]
MVHSGDGGHGPTQPVKIVQSALRRARECIDNDAVSIESDWRDWRWDGEGDAPNEHFVGCGQNPCRIEIGEAGQEVFGDGLHLPIDRVVCVQ